MTKISDETNVERIEHKSKKNIAIGAILGYLAFFVSIIHGLVLTPMILNAFGKVDYGLYGLATSIITLLLLDFGLATATNTYLTRLRAAGDKDGVQRFLAAIFKLYLIIDIAFVAVIALVYFLCPILYKNTYTPQEIEKLQFLVLIVGGYSLISFPSQTFTGVISTYEKFSFNKLADLIQKTLYFAFTIVCIKLDWGIIGITAVNAICGVIAAVIRLVYMRTYLNIKLDLRLKISKTELKSVLKFSMWSLVHAISVRLVINITPSILGIVSDADQVALFTIVTTIEGYIFTFGAIANSFFLAKVARTDAHGSEEERREHLQQLAAKIGKLQFVVITLIFIGFVSVGKEFIFIWLGADQEYQLVYWCIIALCIYDVFNIPQIVFETGMFSRGYMKPLALNAAAKAFINLALSFWLSSKDAGLIGASNIGNIGGAVTGAVGASIAIMIARIVQLILDNISYKKYLKISLPRFFKEIYTRGGITIAIALSSGIALHLFNPVENIKWKFLINGVLVVGIYLLCTLYITFTKDERAYYLDQTLKLLHIRKKNKLATPNNVEVNKEDGTKED